MNGPAISEADYEPNEKDLEWFQGVLDTLKKGGVLIMPNAQLIWDLDAEEKTLALVVGDITEETAKRTATVAARFGWRAFKWLPPLDTVSGG